MPSKGRDRLNGKRIKRLPMKADASKTEAETPEYMRKQKFSEEKIAALQKKLADWEKKHPKNIHD